MLRGLRLSAGCQSCSLWAGLWGPQGQRGAGPHIRFTVLPLLAETNVMAWMLHQGPARVSCLSEACTSVGSSTCKLEELASLSLVLGLAVQVRWQLRNQV